MKISIPLEALDVLTAKKPICFQQVCEKCIFFHFAVDIAVGQGLYTPLT